MAPEPGRFGRLTGGATHRRRPGIAVDVTQTTSLNPIVGMILRLGNQVRALPEEVTKRETRLAAAHQ